MTAVLFVTDPVDGFLADVDATIGLMLAAQDEGAAVWACTPEELAVVDGRVRARARRLAITPRTPRGDHGWTWVGDWFREVDRAVLDVADATDLVLLRIDPPVDARYLHTTYLLDLLEAHGVRVVNRPEGIRALHEKLGALLVPELCPETVVAADVAGLREFVARCGSVVVKPVDGFAGVGVWLVHDDRAAVALLESATHGGTRHVIAQAWLPDVEDGNKRLFVLDGEIAGAVLRRPSASDFRIGPPVAPAALDADDLRIVAGVAPMLARHGIALAGLDVIAGRLIEVNVTCPGGMHKTDALLGTDLSGEVLRRLLLPTASLSERVPA